MNLGTKLINRGFLYQRSKRRNGKAYWDCIRLRAKMCAVRLVTADSEAGESVVILKGGEDQEH